MQPEKLCNDLLSADPRALLHCAGFPSRLRFSGVISQLLPEFVSGALPADASPGRPPGSDRSETQSGVSPATATLSCMERRPLELLYPKYTLCPLKAWATPCCSEWPPSASHGYHLAAAPPPETAASKPTGLAISTETVHVASMQRAKPHRERKQEPSPAWGKPKLYSCTHYGLGTCSAHRAPQLAQC